MQISGIDSFTGFGLILGWVLGLLSIPITVIPVILSSIASLGVMFKTYLELRKMLAERKAQTIKKSKTKKDGN